MNIYVVAVGESGRAFGYLLHSSDRKLQEYADYAVMKMQLQSQQLGGRAVITRGQLVRMTPASLRKQIWNFDRYVLPCLEMGGLSLAVHRGNNQWTFDCEFTPSARFPQRLPSPREVRRMRENPIETETRICECSHDRDSHHKIVRRDDSGQRVVEYGACLAAWCDCKQYTPTTRPELHRFTRWD